MKKNFIIYIFIIFLLSSFNSFKFLSRPWTCLNLRLKFKGLNLNHIICAAVLKARQNART